MDNSDTALAGNCHCGAMSVTVPEEPVATFFCHCQTCQKVSGSPFSVELMCPDAGFETKGDAAVYTVSGDSGSAVHRYSCAKCGSGVYLTCDSDPGYIFLKAGALDESVKVKPEMHIFTAHMQPWVKIDDGLPRFEGMPPAEG